MNKIFSAIVNMFLWIIISLIAIFLIVILIMCITKVSLGIYDYIFLR